jgi:hypothetical protein
VKENTDGVGMLQNDVKMKVDTIIYDQTAKEQQTMAEDITKLKAQTEQLIADSIAKGNDEERLIEKLTNIIVIKFKVDCL